MRRKIIEFWYDDSSLERTGKYAVKLRKLGGENCPEVNNSYSFSDYSHGDQTRRSRGGSRDFRNTNSWNIIRFSLMFNCTYTNDDSICLDPRDNIYRLHHVKKDYWPAFMDCVRKYNLRHAGKFDNVDLGSILVRYKNLEATKDKQCAGK